MEKAKRSPKLALEALIVEMASPRIAASAQQRMHLETEGTKRRLILVDEAPYHGYACSWCGCRFPRADVSHCEPLEALILARQQRQKHFADHVCSQSLYAKHSG
jgi:hypothetical protein